MRATAAPARGFAAKSYSGTHTILGALNCTEERRKGLIGFAFEREMIGPGGTGPKWLRSQKVFKSVVLDPKSALDPNDPRKSQRFYTKDFPIQSFLWGDYSAAPGAAYRFRIVPIDVRQARRTHQRPAGRAKTRDSDREGMGGRRRPRRMVQSRCHREPKVSSEMPRRRTSTIRRTRRWFAKRRDQMRFVLMEKPAPAAVKTELTEDFTHVVLSYGIPLGELYAMKNGKPTARKPIQEFALDKWFFKEELYRPKNDGFVFFVHTKFLLIDPLSDDPLVCSGSANFSPGSLLQNDENMLLIRGDTRVADIYMTEFDRVFRHFYFRDIANELAAKGDDAAAIFHRLLPYCFAWSAGPRAARSSVRGVVSS